MNTNTDGPKNNAPAICPLNSIRQNRHKPLPMRMSLQFRDASSHKTALPTKSWQNNLSMRVTEPVH